MLLVWRGRARSGRRGFHAVAGPVFGEDKRERTLGGGDFDAGLNLVPNFVLDFVLLNSALALTLTLNFT